MSLESAPWLEASRSMRREEWMKSLGAVYFTYVQHRMLDEVAQSTPPRAERVPIGAIIHEPGIPMPYDVLQQASSAASLYVATASIVSLLPDFAEPERQAVLGRYGIDRLTAEAAALHASGGGFINTDFTHFFAPVLANEAVDTFVRSGHLAADEKETFTLHDWANIIGSGWFATLVERMAYGGFGAYGPYGTNVQSLQTGQQGALARRFKEVGVLRSDFDEELFVVKEEAEPADGSVHLTASLHPRAVQGLRQHMEASLFPSAGCPVPRHKMALPRTVMDSTPHIQYLLQKGILAELPAKISKDTATLYQEWTAIDMTLAQIAHQLDAYQRSYGKPLVSVAEKKISIEHQL